jgi:hypothetical protein
LQRIEEVLWHTLGCLVYLEEIENNGHAPSEYS